MNLLAHAILSPDDPGILVGNLTADWIKGRARLEMPAELRAGFELHRRIDSFTDTHPHAAACAELLDPQWGRYSPVLVDIFFDHLLAQAWQDHCVCDRKLFILCVYAALRDRVNLLPPRAQYAAHMMMADDWLSCYATLDGIGLSLTRISSRLNHGIELAPAVRDFVSHRAAFEQAFTDFFPQLQRHVAEALPAAVHLPA